MRIGAIEAGGTKFVCGVGNENGEIEERIHFQTRRPEETMEKVIDFFGIKESIAWESARSVQSILIILVRLTVM